VEDERPIYALTANLVFKLPYFSLIPASKILIISKYDQLTARR